MHAVGARGVRLHVVDSHNSQVEPAAVTDARFFSREMSWLQFNQRVLQQARGTADPLLERLKFLAISDSNLDEFLSIYVAGLLGKAEVKDSELTPDGLTQAQQARRVREGIAAFMHEQRRVLVEELMPELADAGISFARYRQLSATHQEQLRQWFLAEVFPVCTPLAIDPAHPFPFMSNLSVNLGVVLWDSERGRSYARIKAPTMLPRLVRVPDNAVDDADVTFVWLEDIMAHNLDAFFPGVEVRDVCRFRVVRDTELGPADPDTLDLRSTVQAGVRRRRFGRPVCVQLESPHIKATADEWIRRLDVHPEDVYVTAGPLGLRDLAQVLDQLDRPELRDAPLIPRLPAPLAASRDLFAAIRERDLLLHHPFESFQVVIDFIQRAATDPDVLAIKQTLYRVGRKSPLVPALLEALDNGKQVAVALELRAPGDEENNLEWAKTLERAGAHVSYGVVGLNTHAKLAMVVRREPDGLRRYVHISSGNYNANPYADLSLFTCNPGIGADVTELFNMLTGRSRRESFQRLLVAPVSMRGPILARIAREIDCHRQYGRGHIIIKNNNLTDLEVIDALYRASQAGVQVDLIVRGMCCARPGIAGLSENLRVFSVVGRFLEHARAYYFHNGGKEEMFVGSADLMDFSLDSRVDVVAPLLDRSLVRAVKAGLLDLQLSDNVRATVLQPDGAYQPAISGVNPPVDAQLAWTNSHLSFLSLETFGIGAGSSGSPTSTGGHYAADAALSGIETETCRSNN